jgi:hypothetical protein
MSKSIKNILVFLLFFFLSCEKEEQRQTVPFAPVHFRIDVGGFDHSLKNPLAYKIFTQARVETDRVGYGGLLIVSSIDGNQIFAYDLACPVESNRNITITPTKNGTAVCTTCGSEFVTMYGLGTVKSGAARKPLQRYSVQQQDLGVFLIRN